MKRKMLFFERFMYIDGVTPLNCLMTARIKGTIDAAHLQTAITKVQAKHPLLCARVVEEGGEPWFVLDEHTPSIPLAVIARKSAEDWRAITTEQWKIPFDTERGPLLRVIWIRSEEASELMLVGHHCICDGGSIMTLLREILEVTDKPETVLTRYTSYATLDDLVPGEVLADPVAQRAVRKKEILYRLLLAVMGRRNKKHLGGEPYVLYWNADAEEFAAINKRCSVEETNAYAALCVAYLLAFREVQGNAAKNRIMCPVSIRRFIRSVKSDMLFAFAPTIQLALSKSRETDFWTRSRQMKALIGEQIDGMKVYEDLMLGDRMRPYVQRIINFLRSSSGAHDIAFSNVGRLKIPPKYGTFTLEGVVGATVAVPWKNTNTLIMTHYASEMDLGFISNERFLPKRDAEAIQGAAIRLLREAMRMQPVAQSAASAVSATD
jgi:NRPS condensation-like uncharacterized protein